MKKPNYQRNNFKKNTFLSDEENSKFNQIQMLSKLKSFGKNEKFKSNIRICTIANEKLMYSDKKQDSLDIIDRAMEIQQILYEFSSELNSYFQFQLLLIILTAFIVIIFNCFYLLSIFGGQVKSTKLTKLESLAFLGYELFVCCSNVIGIVVVCSMLQNSFKETGKLIHKILIYTYDQKLRERLTQFSLQLKYNKPRFTAFGLFPIDGSLIYSIAGATTTYLVILLQFSDSPPHTNSNNIDVMTTFINNETNT